MRGHCARRPFRQLPGGASTLPNCLSMGRNNGIFNPLGCARGSVGLYRTRRTEQPVHGSLGPCYPPGVCAARASGKELKESGPLNRTMRFSKRMTYCFRRTKHVTETVRDKIYEMSNESGRRGRRERGGEGHRLGMSPGTEPVPVARGTGDGALLGAGGENAVGGRD